jgi:hypoxia up-regulated 1
MGAGTTTATLISFHSGTDSKKGIKNLVDIDVKGVSVLPIGGLDFDLILQSHIVQDFKKKTGKSLEDNNRALARILKESNRCKTILSANKVVNAGIESLLEDVDYKSQISREDFETMAKPLLEKVTHPIEDVLKSTGVKMEEVKSLVLFGGAVRMPAVQLELAQLVGEEKIARNIDGDEAAVFGAVLHAAKTSGQFRLGQVVRLKDLNSKGINISYPTSKKTQKSTLFTEKSVLGTTKTMTFKRDSDFDMTISYESADIALVRIEGVNEAFAKYNVTPKIIVSLTLDESGLFSVGSAKGQFEIQPKPKDKESLTDKVLGLFGSKSGEKEKEEEKQTDAQPETPNDESETTENTGKKEDNNESGKQPPKSDDKEDSKNKKKKEKEISTDKVVIETVKFNVIITPMTVLPMKEEEISTAYSRYPFPKLDY